MAITSTEPFSSYSASMPEGEVIISVPLFLSSDKLYVALQALGVTNSKEVIPEQMKSTGIENPAAIFNVSVAEVEITRVNGLYLGKVYSLDGTSLVIMVALLSVSKDISLKRAFTPIALYFFLQGCIHLFVIIHIDNPIAIIVNFELRQYSVRAYFIVRPVLIFKKSRCGSSCINNLRPEIFLSILCIPIKGAGLLTLSSINFTGSFLTNSKT